MESNNNNNNKKEAKTAPPPSVEKRVRRIFDLAVNPPPKLDPDPGNPVPFVIRKDINKYRTGFYLALVGLIALTISTPRTYLFHPVTGEMRFDQMVTGIVFLVLFLISHWLVTGSDPGYLEIDIAVRLGEEHAQHQELNYKHTKGFVGLSRTPSSEIVISSPANTSQKRRAIVKNGISPRKIQPLSSSSSSAINKNHHITDEEEQREESTENDDDDDLESSKLITHNNNDENDDDDDDDDADDDADGEPDEVLDQNLSGISSQQLPTRAKFCRKSRRVVATYDHHCRVLNTTIGERNRARFWFLLLWGTCGMSWLLSVVHSGFRNSPASVGAWLDRNGQALASTVICWVVFLVCAGLFVFHTFLMLANVTTFEFMRADKVSYLTDTRDFDLPFSMGLAQNIRFYFSSDSSVLTLINLVSGKRIEWKPHLWTRPNASTFDRNSTDICKNVWENKYWSCC